MPNESKADRVVRFFLSLVLFFLAAYGLKGVWKDVFYVLSAVSLLTSLTGFCPLYSLFKFKTLK